MKFKFLILFILSVFLLVSCADVEEPELPIVPEQKEEVGNLVTFGAFSDIHSSAEYFNRVVDNIFTLTNDGEDLDAMVLLGDILYTHENVIPSYENYSFIVENEKYQKLYNEGKIVYAMGNHEFPVNSSDPEQQILSKQSFKEVLGLEMETDNVYGGYHFITAGPDAYAGYLSPEQEAYVIKHVNDALAESDDKPVFLFLHHPIDNTTYGSYGTDHYTEDFENFIKNEPRLVVFYGHVHTPASDPRAINQNPGGATFVYTSVVWTSVGQSMSYATQRHEQYASQAHIVTVDDKTNVVTIKPFYTDAKEPEYLEKVEWTLDIPAMIEESKKDNVSLDVYKYTDVRKESSVAPFFAEDAEITVDRVGESAVTFSFPNAVCGDDGADSDVAFYKIEIFDAETDELIRCDKIISDFFVKNKREAVSHSFYNLPETSKWILKVTPVTVWHVEGEGALTLEIIPPEPLFAPVSYDEKNTFETPAKDGKIYGFYSEGEEYISATKFQSLTLIYKFDVKSAGMYRVIANVATNGAVDATLTVTNGTDVDLSSDIYLGTSGMNDYQEIVLAEIEVQEAGEYTVKIKKANGDADIRFKSVKFARCVEE